MDNSLLLLSKDTEQVPGQHQGTGNVALLVLDVANDGSTNKDQTGHGQDNLERRGALIVSGGNSGKDVDDKEDKDPGVVEREGQVQEDVLQDSLRDVVLLQAVVDVGDTAGGEQQRNQGEDGVTLGLIDSEEQRKC